MNKKLFTLLIDLLLLICLCACASHAQKIKKQLELGNKYLVELEYEQAILAFNKIIEIDPKNTDAYKGLGDAYYGEAKSASDYSTADTLYLNATGNYGIVIDLTSDGTGTTTTDISLEEINQNIKEIMADLYLEWSDLALKEGDIDHAAKILEDGYEILGDAKLLERSQTIGDINDAGKLIEDLDVSSDDFNISSDNVDKLMAITDMYNGKYISTENGEGFGLYKVDGEYYLFRGNFKNGLREGLGLIALINSDTYVKCEWNEDVPFGDAEYFSRYKTKRGGLIICSAEFQLINGLYDGEGKETSIGDTDTTFFSIRQGKLVNLGPDNKNNGFYYFGVLEDGWLYASAEKRFFDYTYGLPGYAEKFEIF